MYAHAHTLETLTRATFRWRHCVCFRFELESDFFSRANARTRRNLCEKKREFSESPRGKLCSSRDADILIMLIENVTACVISFLTGAWFKNDFF